MSLRVRIERLERETLQRMPPPSPGLWSINVQAESSPWVLGYPPGVWWNGDPRMPCVKVVLRHGEKLDEHLLAVLESQMAPWGKTGISLSEHHCDGSPAPPIPTPPPGWGYQEHLAASFQPLLDRRRREPEGFGRPLLGESVEIAKHEYRPISFAQAGEFLVNRSANLDPTQIINGRQFLGRSLGLMLAPAGGPSPGLEGRTIRDPVQPCRERFRIADRPGAAEKKEEGGLEGVVGIRVIA